MKTVLISPLLLFARLTSTASCAAENSVAWRLRVSSNSVSFCINPACYDFSQACWCYLLSVTDRDILGD